VNERPNQRVTVTHPRTVTPQTGKLDRPTIDLTEESPVSDIALRSLMRAQLRLSLIHIAALVALLTAVPLLAVWVESLSTTRVVGVPVMWIILGAGMFPPLLLIAQSYVRRVEALERRTLSLLRG
jgi:uncharacterized membrane protein